MVISSAFICPSSEHVYIYEFLFGTVLELNTMHDKLQKAT